MIDGLEMTQRFPSNYSQNQILSAGQKGDVMSGQAFQDLTMSDAIIY